MLTLSTWNYKKLDNAVKQYTQKQNNIAISIFEAVNKAVNSLSINEIEFQAKVQDSLTNGRFSLMIVGDKIHPQATQISETIQSAPNLQLSLCFIELSCYKLEKDSNWPLIIVPNCITKTKEITRAVVRVIYEEKRPDVRIETVQEEGETTSQTNLSIFIASLPNNIRDVFKIYLERWMRQGYDIYWGKVGFSLRIPWKGELTTVFDAYPYYIGILSEEYINKHNLPEDSFLKYKKALVTSSIIGSALAAERSYYDYTDMTVDDVMLILKVVDDFVNELCHK